ncbi:GNAT family N-acetyltransferase [Pedobacter vanadiisoli]|uniref:GNAT family N-acetyltransferase n=1 Tax=Pedobacter vanadiisoli TaxID=1761975 RepID=A0ABW5MIE0_9SPHI
MLDEINIRTELKPGDLSYVIYKQTLLYQQEHSLRIEFESYAFAGMHEFCESYDPEKDRVWVCEHKKKIIGFILLMHRENNASQLRFFYIDVEYRGIGLGKKLMQLYMDFFKEKGYQSSYLWTFQGLDTAISLYTRHGFKLTEEKLSKALGKLVNEQRYDLSIDEGSSFHLKAE